MVTFDAVLPTILAIVESLPDFAHLKRCAIIRDLRGRVRLVIDEAPNLTLDRARAEQSLKTALGAYFQAPIAALRGAPDEKRLVDALLKKAKPLPPGTSYLDPISGESRSPDVKWSIYEARLSKSAWLDRSTSDRLWEPGAGPCITTFFSFKGGVGRTTALAACAWQLASEGARVVVIDLDLEAPGAGALLGVQTPRGILDVLVDRLATGSVDLTDSHALATALGPESASVHVFPAGALNESFIEKLARLDYTQAAADAATAHSPIEHALREILQKINADLRPDHIFLDARSGLHDLSALSLLRLAHVDVLLARANEQSYQGFDLTLRTLLRRKGAQHLQTIVVHTMAVPGGTRSALEEQEQFTERAYRTFNEAYYRPHNCPFALDDNSAPHAATVVFHNESLVRFGSLEAIRDVMFAREYRYLCDRIKLLAQPRTGGAPP